MKGQWVGQNTGTNPGGMVVNFDEFEDHYGGLGIVTPHLSGVPITVATLKTKDKSAAGKFTAPLAHFDRDTFTVLDQIILKSRYPTLVFPDTADVEYRFTGSSLDVKWISPIGTLGNASLPKSQADAPSVIVAPIKSWSDFKLVVDTLPYRKFVFRGQPSSKWRLRTAYHRLGRANVERFRVEDMGLLNQYLNGQTRHIYNMSDASQFGALLHLAQHHGYPTPLLDWTYSPYVAAFFAFRSADPTTTANARIFVLNSATWISRISQDVRLSTPRINFTLLEFPVLDNLRMVAQQALSSVTSVDDIEQYMQFIEVRDGIRVLEAIDISSTERHTVMRDLARMGITAASMFPGLDGICENLKERMFV